MLSLPFCSRSIPGLTSSKMSLKTRFGGARGPLISQPSILLQTPDPASGAAAGEAAGEAAGSSAYARNAPTVDAARTHAAVRRLSRVPEALEASSCIFREHGAALRPRSLREVLLTGAPIRDIAGVLKDSAPTVKQTRTRRGALIAIFSLGSVAGKPSISKVDVLVGWCFRIDF